MTDGLYLWVNEEWQRLPVRRFIVTDSARNPVSELWADMLESGLTTEQLNALDLYQSVYWVHHYGEDDFSWYGRIMAHPKRHIGPEEAIIELACYDETHDATRYRFIDSWPKTDIATWKEIVEDAWTRYGPHGITFTGVGNNTDQPDYIESRFGTLYDFMEEIAQRTGWRWKVVENDLQFYDPTDNVSGIEINSLNVRPDSMVDEGMPEVANVAFIPAQFKVADFVDSQTTEAGRAQYFLQYSPYTPLTGFLAGEDKPVITLNGTPIDPDDIALDGSIEADEAVVVWNPDNRFLRFTNGNVPDGAYALVATYDALFPVTVERQHDISIALYDEIHHLISKSPRPTREEAEEIADAYLAVHALPVRTFHAEVTEKRVRCGWYYSVVLPGIDQLMPCAATQRVGETDGSYTVTATFDQAPTSDTELIFDIFRRLEKLEARDMGRDERLERDLNVEDNWEWTDEVVFGWSDVEWISDNDHELKHNALYVFEQTDGRFVYPC